MLRGLSGPGVEKQGKGHDLGGECQTYINDVFETMNGGPCGPQYGQTQQYLIQALQKAALEDDPIDQILKETEQNLRTV
jgi:hypothetical protein